MQTQKFRQHKNYLRSAASLTSLATSADLLLYDFLSQYLLFTHLLCVCIYSHRDTHIYTHIMQLWLHLHQPCPRLRCTPSRQCPAAVPGRSLWFWCDWATSPGHYGLPGPCGPASSPPDTSSPSKERQNQRRGAAGGWLWIHGAVNHFHSMIAAVCSHRWGKCQCEQRIIVITVIIINRCFDRVLHHRRSSCQRLWKTAGQKELW